MIWLPRAYPEKLESSLAALTAEHFLLSGTLYRVPRQRHLIAAQHSQMDHLHCPPPIVPMISRIARSGQQTTLFTRLNR
jgi:hypothetical protein